MSYLTTIDFEYHGNGGGIAYAEFGPVLTEPTDKAAWIKFAAAAIAPTTLAVIEANKRGVKLDIDVSEDAAQFADVMLAEMKKRFPTG